MDYNRYLNSVGVGTGVSGTATTTGQSSELLNFEPQTRARSNTWPCKPAIEEINPTQNHSTFAGQPCDHSPLGFSSDHGGASGGGGGSITGSGLLQQKKSTSRRNAWGNLSYADLITQAISSSPEKRLTLSQIYDWMVSNVPYFKDKGDSNSSAGWKNSIRHNLSLHNRFVRVQNEGTGKSSWWMLNPDAKPGKAARRRATSMETSKYEKKRGRIRKKIEAMRNGTTLLSHDTPSPCSSLGEGLDLFPVDISSEALAPPSGTTTFQLSPLSDFRPRASSNASSCGRLSPILTMNESEVDLHDSQVPPMSPWVDYYSSGGNNGAAGFAGGMQFGLEEVQLAGNLANMVKIQGDYQESDFYSFEDQQRQQREMQLQQDFFYNQPNTLSTNSTATPKTNDPSQLYSIHQHSKGSITTETPVSNNTSTSIPSLLQDFEQQIFCDDGANDDELQNELLGLGAGDFFQQQQNGVLYNYGYTPNPPVLIQQPVGPSSSNSSSSSNGATSGRQWVH